MGRNVTWKTNEIYSEKQVESVVRSLDITVTGETETNILALCPFHPNSNTPAFSVDKEKGLYMCFAPHCGEKGNLIQLVEKMLDVNEFSARRRIDKYASEIDYSKLLTKTEPEEFVIYDQKKLDALKATMPNSAGEEYMLGRGFSKETIEYFDIGYNPGMKMVAVPMHDPHGNPVGIIGRAIEGKRFKNSPGLPKKRTAWNYHRAKKESSTVIICESSFDAMKIHQAGFPNVIALLGGYISTEHVEQINRAFSSVIIFTDNDEAGRKLGHSIAEKLSHKDIRWAAYSPDGIYPGGVKDATDIPAEQIQHLVRKAITPLEYDQWYL